MNPALVEYVRAQLRTKRRRKSKRPPAWLYPSGAEASLRRFYRLVVGALVDDFREILLPRLPTMVAEASRQRGDSARDSWVDDIDNIRRRFEEGLLARRAGYLSQVSAVATAAAAHNLRQWGKVAKASLGVDIFSTEPWLRDELRSWAAENVKAITTLEDRAASQMFNRAQRGIREGTRHEDIGKAISEQFGVERRRAELLARDQVGTLNAGLTEQRQRDLGVEEYTWRTSLDERVRGNPSGKYPDARPSHHVMEGKICRWDDPTVYKNPSGGPWKGRSSIGGVEEHPSLPILCRCSAEPRLDKLLEDL